VSLKDISRGRHGNKRLALNREAVRELRRDELSAVAGGGATNGCFDSLPITFCQCTGNYTLNYNSCINKGAGSTLAPERAGHGPNAPLDAMRATLVGFGARRRLQGAIAKEGTA
jgi:hypothetical protein